MAEQEGQEKTEPATDKKRREEREKGNVAKSTDLSAAIVLLVSILVLKFTGHALLEEGLSICAKTYRDIATINLTPDLLADQATSLLVFIIKGLVPFLLMLTVAAVGSNVLQVGFMFAHKALIPKFSKLNVISGFKQMLSARSLVESLKGILKIAIIGSIGYYVIHKHISDFLVMAYTSLGESIATLSVILFELTLKIGIAYLVLAVLDYAYQRHHYEESIKMTKQEKADESKQYEGNPEVKGKIRSAQRLAANKRMMAVVPDATVVLTNPTYIAVALKYEMAETLSAPIVVAKGKRKIAERIKAIAKENDIPIIENKPLARGLFATTEIGMQIPAEFFQAVAEILARIYRKSQKQNQPLGNLAHAV